MYLPAISIGYAVPAGSFSAVVHSVFRSALNLRLSRGELLTIASDEVDLPQGIRLDAPQDFSFEIFPLGEGMTCRDGVLRLGSLTIDLRTAHRWKCDLPSLKVDVKTPAVSSAWSFVWNALNRRQRLSKAEIIGEDLFRSNETAQNVLSRKAGEAMRILVNATRRYDVTNTSAVNSLIGLGSGLTPSGDDLLVGYLAGLWCTAGDNNERMKFVSGLGKSIIQHSKQTNDISRTYLYHASQGQVSSLLVDLAEAISRGEGQKRLVESAEAAMQIGHTSGMDAVTGLLVGLAIWDTNQLF